MTARQIFADFWLLAIDNVAKVKIYKLFIAPNKLTNKHTTKAVRKTCKI